MELLRVKVAFDKENGVALGGQDERSEHLVMKVALLPASLELVGKTYEELLEICRNCGGKEAVDFYLHHYLPGYAGKLLSDLEAALAEGNNVYLWESLGKVLVFGHAILRGSHPWSDTEHWYMTAQDTLNKKNPKTLV